MKSLSYSIFVCLSIMSCVVLSSCQNEDDATPISVWYDDTAIPTDVNSGDRFQIKAQLFTGNGETIKSYEIIFDDYKNPTVLKSEELNGATSYMIDFYADVPYVTQDEMKCKISTHVYGMAGFENTISKMLTVHGALKEFSGFKLYSSTSGKNNGFLLDDLNITYKKSELDSLDVYFASEDEKECWKTSSDEIDFVKANNFNFAKATLSNLSQTYESSIKAKVVENIKAEDIILVGKSKKAWGAFCCLAYDRESQLYTFSYKLIPQERQNLQ